MPPEVHEAVHSELFIAMFGLASVVAALALLLHLRKARGRSATAAIAMVVVTLSLALACEVVVGVRRHVDAALESDRILSACYKALNRRDGYGEARATAYLALQGAPLALLLTTFIAACRPRRLAWFGWTALAWALFAAVGYMYLQPLPGSRFPASRCALYGERDAILHGIDGEAVSQGCLRLADALKNPLGLGYALGDESQATVIPELSDMKRKCLADLLQWIRHSSPDEISRADTLGSPFVTPDDVPEVTRFLDEVKPHKPWEIDGGDEGP